MGDAYATLVVLGYIGRVGLDGYDPDDYIRPFDVMLSAGVPADGQDFLCMATLHHAVNLTGTCNFVKVALKHKANVSLQDRFGFSPLLIAIQRNIPEVILVLLDAGTDLNVTDGEGSSPRSEYLTRPAKVSDAVMNCLVRHEGRGTGTASVDKKRLLSVVRDAGPNYTAHLSAKVSSPDQILFLPISCDTLLNQGGGLERTQKVLPTS